MELSFVTILPFAFLFVLFSLSFTIFFNQKAKASTAATGNLPPRKTGLPFLGESHEFLSDGWKGQSKKFIHERMAKFSPQAFKTSLFGAPMVLVTVWWPSSINKIFPSSNQTSSNDEMKKMRKLLPQFLRTEALHRYIGIMDTIAQSVRAIIKQRKIDLAENKASPTQDILSHMLLAPDEDGKYMQQMDIADKILGCLLEDTTLQVPLLLSLSNILLSFLMSTTYKQMEIAKAKAPGELLNWEDLQKMKYSWNVAFEVMRLVPPLEGAFREAITDFLYAGFSVPKGWKLYWSAHSTHQNPEYFPKPEKFDPSRFEGTGPVPYTYIPFGGGPRMCPGKEYARLEILVFMHNLVTRFKWEKVLPHEKIVVNPMPIPEKGLPIRLFRHNSSQSV
ncbi:unnamed protein product [Camellia sinensis]